MAFSMEQDPSPIIFYYYFDLADPGAFCRLLEQRFRASGHSRAIEFRSWDCYDQDPPRDGDVYCYDSCIMSAMVHGGYLRQLPDIIDTSRVFDWIIDRSRFRGKIYGIPFMTCANVLISRARDRITVKNVFDLPEDTAAPMKSMAPIYYINALGNYQNRKDELLQSLQQLRRVVGDERYQRSRLCEYDGTELFNRGECRCLIGFTEDLRKLKPDDYRVQILNFSDSETNEMPFLPADFASIGVNVSGEKLLDCIDLLEFCADSDFIYEVCTVEGRLQYMLPADRTVYARLAAIDPIYHALYMLASNEDNALLRFGKGFFADYRALKKEILQVLEET